MTDKELVERLNAYSAQYQNHGGITAEAADRIEQLRAELTNERIDNTNLIGELAMVAAERDRYKAERDAAVRDMKQNTNGLKFVPIIDTSYILPDTVDKVLEYAHGKSTLGSTLREGIVFRSQDGKVSFKAVDPLFLIKYDE